MFRKNYNFWLIFIFLFFFFNSFSFSQEQKVINKTVVEDAQKVIGLSFTEEEIDSLIDDLNNRIAQLQNVRKINLQNSVPPAILFNPIPLNYKNTEKQKPLVFSDYSKGVLPENIEDLAYCSIGELAFLIKNKKITSMQLTKMYIERLKKYNPMINCIVTLTEERALEEAKTADKEIASGKYRGLLHGIPYGIKDLFTTKGYKTTWGAFPYKDQFIDEDATLVKKLKNAGAVLVAKLSMGELAMGDTWFNGRTRNPWDTSKGSSGSSAGPASSVSAGLLPFAIGTETRGSIVSPSTVCGVTGLRPTYGRTSRYGAMALSWSMDKVGPICRNAEDCAIVFNAIYGLDDKDQTIYDYPFNYDSRTEIKKFKIGYLKKDFAKKYGFKEQDSLLLKKLTDLGIELIPIELPNLPIRDIGFILTVEAAAAFDDLTRSNKDDLLSKQLKWSWPNTFRSVRFIPAVEYINANRIRYLLIQEMEKILENVDMYIGPSFTGDNLALTNLTGHPCIVLPDGFTKEGTPTSITITGKLFQEGKIILLAKKIQEITDFHLKHPKLN